MCCPKEAGEAGKMDKMEREMMAEDDLRTMQRAHEVHSDRGRHSRARALAGKKMAGLKKLFGRKLGKR
jgi:hypothetical protein